jgi:calmodulin
MIIQQFFKFQTEAASLHSSNRPPYPFSFSALSLFFIASMQINPSTHTCMRVSALPGDRPHTVDNRITFQEFVPILKAGAGSKPSGSEAQFVEGLSVFGSKDGGISASELRHVLTSLGEKLSDEDVDQLLRKMKVAEGGTVNVAEFVQMVMA